MRAPRREAPSRFAVAGPPIICVVFLLFGSLLTPTDAAAEDAGDCDAISIPDPAVSLARVGGLSRSTFVKSAADQAGCPSAAPACRSTAFVVPGDLVIIGATHGPFTCADYVGRTGLHRAGWLRSADLIRLPPATVEPADWTGHWGADESYLTIATATAGRLHVDGYATSGSHDPERVRLGAINVGQFTVTVVPTGDTLRFATDPDGKAVPFEQGGVDDCKVWLRRLGPFLLSRDNNQCGGLNVTFDGVYRRKR